MPVTIAVISSCPTSVFLSVEFSSSCEISILGVILGLQVMPNCKAGGCAEGSCVPGRGNILIFECQWCIQVPQIVLQGLQAVLSGNAQVSILEAIGPGRRDRCPASESQVWAQESGDSHNLASQQKEGEALLHQRSPLSQCIYFNFKQ